MNEINLKNKENREKNIQTIYQRVIALAINDYKNGDFEQTEFGPKMKKRKVSIAKQVNCVSQSKTQSQLLTEVYKNTLKALAHG